jgi:hypothetical protein
MLVCILQLDPPAAADGPRLPAAGGVRETLRRAVSLRLDV